MTRFLPLLLIALWTSVSVSAQKNQSDSQNLSVSYFGLTPPGETPEIFAPGIVSNSGLEHSKISFSKDGSSFYWAAQPSLKTNRIQQRIWFIQNHGGVWSQPAELNVPEIALATPTFSPDGKELYFIGSDDQSATNPDQVKNQLYVLDLQTKNVRNISAQYPLFENCWSFSFAANGDIYFDYSGGKNWEIYVMKKQNGKYSSSEKLPLVINDGNNSIHPFISPGGDFLLFSSSRPGGKGSADLYIGFKDKNGQWEKVKNLGPDINTEARERFPSLSHDGKNIFFTRRDDAGNNDFYWVDAGIIEELKTK